MQTQELLQHLCINLGHQDAVTALVKKLVSENWLEKVDDLRQTPRDRLENWGVPLKLISELQEELQNDEAKANVAGVNAWVNYTARPWVQRSAPYLLTRAFKDNVQRRVDPEEWAALRLQGAWRCRKLRQQKAQDEVLVAFDMEDFATQTEEEKYRIRRERAEARIKRFVRRWRYNRLKKGSSKVPSHPTGSAAGARVAARRQTALAAALQVADQAVAAAAASDPEVEVFGYSISKHLAQASQGKMRNCEVTELLVKLGKNMGKSKEEMAPHIHRLVTLNWLEDIDDLRLIEEHHWADWEMPERLVIAIKADLLERREARVSEGVGNFGRGIVDFVARLCGVA